MTPDDLRLRIEHTLLDPAATADDVRRTCDEAGEYGFIAVCVAPARLALAARALQGRPIAVATVAGFPHGTSLTEIKAWEAELAWGSGATDIDWVLHPGAVRDGDREAVAAEMRRIRGAVPEAVLKVILETGRLTPEEVRWTAECAVGEGIDFVKTSTGYGPRGATVEDVRRLREVVGDRCRIKAAGGIRTRADALALVAAGADRIGTSRGPELVTESTEGSGGRGE